MSDQVVLTLLNPRWVTKPAIAPAKEHSARPPAGLVLLVGPHFSAHSIVPWNLPGTWQEAWHIGTLKGVVTHGSGCHSSKLCHGSPMRSEYPDLNWTRKPSFAPERLRDDISACPSLKSLKRARQESQSRHAVLESTQMDPRISCQTKGRSTLNCCWPCSRWPSKTSHHGRLKIHRKNKHIIRAYGATLARKTAT